MSFILPLKVALRYVRSSGRSHRFAAFVAVISTLGITIGVAALLVVSAVMAGLEGRLQGAVLGNTPHIIADLPAEAAPALLEIPGIIAVAPYLEGEALLQSKSALRLVRLRGLEARKVQSRTGLTLDTLAPHQTLPEGSWTLAGDSGVFTTTELRPGDEVRLISTRNARYTPLGLTPTTRLFTIGAYTGQSTRNAVAELTGNLEDVRRFFRVKSSDLRLRLWLLDPTDPAPVSARIRARFPEVTLEDWQSREGEFFRAVAMERVSMSVMLCLIIVVAAFNILSSLTMMVSSRLKEIAILKTLGLTEGRIQAIFLCMGLSCGVLGTLTGLALGVPLALNAGDIISFLHLSILPGGQSLPARLDFSTVALIGAGSLALAALSSWYPAHVAARADPSHYLREV